MVVYQHAAKMMERSTTKWIFYFVMFLPAAPSVFGQDPRIETIDSLLRTCYNDSTPGAAVYISTGKKTFFDKAYGLADVQTKEPAGVHTNFNIGSLTKQFTAFCILDLEEKKQLSLDDKLIKYFPGFNKKVGELVSIRQLLSHSSGIADHYAFTDTAHIRHATDKDVLYAVQHIDSTYFIPGTRYRYSNTAYCLLALIIEKVSGRSYPDYLQHEIFNRLGMRRTTVIHDGAPIIERAIGYEYDSSKQTFRKQDADEGIFFTTEGDGGIYTSISDYALWWQFLQDTTKKRYKNVIEAVRSPHLAVQPETKLFYGYGWFVSNLDTARVVYHTGSNGGFRAIVFSIPSQNYVVVIFSNRTGIDLEKLVQQINDIMGVTNNSFTKIDGLVSFINSWPIFAPCKETPWFLILYKRNCNANVMA